MYLIAPLELRPAVEAPPRSRLPGEAPWALEWGVMGLGGRYARVRMDFDRATGLVNGWRLLELVPDEGSV